MGLHRFEVGPETPRPLLTRVAHLRLGPFIVTAIMRHWETGDSGKQGRCRLCPTCFAHQDGCLILIGEGVSRAEAPLYETHGKPVQRWLRRIGSRLARRPDQGSDG